MVPMGGVEPPTTGLWVLCSTAELHWHERNSRDFQEKATLFLWHETDNKWIFVIFAWEMLDKSYYHEDEPCDEDNRHENNSYNENDERKSNKSINDETEIEINDFKTCFFLQLRQSIFLDKIIENHEDETKCTAWEEIPCEVKYAQHFDTFNSSRICGFFNRRCCFFCYWFNDFSSYFFDWRFLWSCLLRRYCSLLSNWRSLFLCCLFWSRFLWSSFFGSALFCSGICFYHVRNTKQTIS